MTKSSYVMMVEDHVLVRQALKQMLEADGRVEVKCEVSSWQDALVRQQEDPCDVIIMDIALPQGSGIDGIEQMRRRWPQLPILALSAHQDTNTILDALRAGASGYLAKSAGLDQLMSALQVILGGGSYLEPHTTKIVLAHLSEFPRLADESSVRARSPQIIDNLTPRERQIMELVAQGKSNRAIAESLMLTETTVKSYLRTLYRRLSVSDRAHAVACAIRAGLMSPPAGVS